MSAKSVMKAVKESGISIVAITDHNSLSNCSAYEYHAQQNGIKFIYGVEIQTIEEIHIIALFNKKKEAMNFDKELYQALLPVNNKPDYFGDQVIIDADENIVKFEERALINSVKWSLEETVQILRQMDTFIFPAHIDADTFSIIGQLGFIPPEIEFDALGVSAKCDLQSFLDSHSYLQGKTFLRNSDAHYLDQIGSGYTRFLMQEPTLSEIGFACQKNGARKAVIE